MGVRLLFELGLVDRIPPRAPRLLVDSMNAHSLRFFSFRVEDLPPGKDPEDVPCHCQLGTMMRVLHACGIDVDRELSWFRPWFLEYQLPDGGLNCDEAAYTRPAPRSSFLSTVPPAEALLACGATGADEERFLARAAEYLLNRRLYRSISKDAPADPEWLVPCFPRFYDYDVLRGLTVVSRWAERTGAAIPRAAVAEALEACERAFADGGRALAPRDAFPNMKTRRQDASGAWETTPVGTFPLLELARTPEVSVPVLLREWEETRARIELRLG